MSSAAMQNNANTSFITHPSYQRNQQQSYAAAGDESTSNVSSSLTNSSTSSFGNDNGNGSSKTYARNAAQREAVAEMTSALNQPIATTVPFSFSSSSSGSIPTATAPSTISPLDSMLRNTSGSKPKSHPSIRSGSQITPKQDTDEWILDYGLQPSAPASAASASTSTLSTSTSSRTIPGSTLTSQATSHTKKGFGRGNEDEFAGLQDWGNFSIPNPTNQQSTTNTEPDVFANLPGFSTDANITTNTTTTQTLPGDDDFLFSW